MVTYELLKLAPKSCAQQHKNRTLTLYQNERPNGDGGAGRERPC